MRATSDVDGKQPLNWTPIDWEARLKEAVEKTLRERERKKAERREFALRRMHGLAARHAAKLARLKKEQEES